LFEIDIKVNLHEGDMVFTPWIQK